MPRPKPVKDPKTAGEILQGRAQLRPTKEVRKKMGRPTVWTDEVKQRLLQGVELGLPYNSAAPYAGISRETLNEALKLGAKQQPGEEWREFSDRLMQARAKAQARHVLNISKASDAGDIRASTWFLERTDPENWGRKDQLDAKVHHDGGISLTIDHIREAARRAREQGP